MSIFWYQYYIGLTYIPPWLATVHLASRISQSTFGKHCPFNRALLNDATQEWLVSVLI